MLNQVCCIVDVEGFSVQHRSPVRQSYRNDFLVRELGYVRVDPDYEYLPRSYRFDLSNAYDFAGCTEQVRRTLRYQSRQVTGLSLLPGPSEETFDPSHLIPYLLTIYDRCRRPQAELVAYKGGQREAEILRAAGIPALDLQKFGCPPFEKWVERRSREEYRDCGHHSKVGRPVAHCSMAEVAAYRDWFMENVRSASYRQCVRLSFSEDYADDSSE